MLAMAVGLIVLVGAMKIYPIIERNQQQQDALVGLNQLNANITKAFSTQGNFNGLDNQTAIQMGLVPDVLRTDASSGKILGPWSSNGGGTGSGNVDVIKDANDQQIFRITYYNLPLDMCLNIASNFLPQNLKAVYNGSTAINIDSKSRQNTIDIAKQACGTSDPVSSVSWALTF
jgi:multisubunit Na+/H+ antiporter MnhF subunit